MAYKKETDYMALMNKAALAGNLEEAAELERKRNEKIEGEGLSYHKTYVYNKAPQGVAARKSTAAVETKTPKTADGTKYAAKKDKALDAVLSVADFSYDVTKDPLFAQYEKMYSRAAKRAGEDTMARAAETTGGLASSYAVTAAAQAENAQMDKLTDKIPELYQLAYDRYLKDIDTKIKKLSAVSQADDTAYDRYTKSLARADQNKENDRAYALAAGEAAWSQMLSEAELTGVYKNQPTLAAQKLSQADAQNKQKLLKENAWQVLAQGIYDESFPDILGLSPSTLQLMAQSVQAEKQQKTDADRDAERKELAWAAIENGIYEDWFSDVLALSPENLQAMANYQAQKKIYEQSALRASASGGSGTRKATDKITYGDVMVAMVESDDPYGVFMTYAPELERADYQALYDAMKGIEYSKNKKKKIESDTLNQKLFLPIQFGQTPEVAAPILPEKSDTPAEPQMEPADDYSTFFWPLTFTPFKNR